MIGEWAAGTDIVPSLPTVSPKPTHPNAMAPSETSPLEQQVQTALRKRIRAARIRFDLGQDAVAAGQGAFVGTLAALLIGQVLVWIVVALICKIAGWSLPSNRAILGWAAIGGASAGALLSLVARRELPRDLRSNCTHGMRAGTALITVE